MILDIIQLPNRVPHNTIVDTSGFYFNYNSVLDDIFSEGRMIHLNPRQKFYKYKLIEEQGELIIERIIGTFSPLDMIKISTVGSDIDMFQLSIKLRSISTGRIVGFYRFVDDCIDLLNCLNTDRVSNYTSSLSLYLWHLSFLAAFHKHYNVCTELDHIYKNNNRVIDGLANCNKSYHDNAHLHEAIKLTSKCIESSDCDPFINKSKSTNWIYKPINDIVKVELDNISKCGLMNQDLMTKGLRCHAHPSYNGHLFLFQTNYEPVFPIDKDVNFNQSLSENHAMLAVLNYLETLPYTDISFGYDSSGEIELLNVRNRFESANTIMLEPRCICEQAEVDLVKAKALLRNLFKPIITSDAVFKATVHRTWLEEVYIEIVYPGFHTQRIYIDLVIWGLGSPALIEGHAGYREHYSNRTLNQGELTTC